MVRSFYLAATMVAVLATPVEAQVGECRSNHSQSVLHLVSWNAGNPDTYGLSTLSMELLNATDKAVKMVDGYVVFMDALGSDIDTFTIDRDYSAQAGERAVSVALLRYSRLTEVAMEDVGAVACVRAVIFADGSKEEF